MKRIYHFRIVAIVALLLPGLVLAAPIAGSCGLCGDGDACHLTQEVKTVPEVGSCCESEKTGDPGEQSFGFSKCECGRDAPKALASSSPTIEVSFSLAQTVDVIDALDRIGEAFIHSSRPPPPPPAPPAYLIDCAFLT